MRTHPGRALTCHPTQHGPHSSFGGLAQVPPVPSGPEGALPDICCNSGGGAVVPKEYSWGSSALPRCTSLTDARALSRCSRCSRLSLGVPEAAAVSRLLDPAFFSFVLLLLRPPCCWDRVEAID